jgi:hypothetical protein
MLTFEGEEFLGGPKIVEKLVVCLFPRPRPIATHSPILQSLPFQKTAHRIVTLDAQPFPGGILVMITGELTVRHFAPSTLTAQRLTRSQVDDSEHPIKFSQVFSLVQDGASFFV